MSTIVTIQSTDLITNSRTDINTNFSNLNTDKMETSVLDTDTAMAANSDAKVATQKAAKAYTDSVVGANASETVKGLVEEATDAEMIAGTATGATGAKLVVTPAKLSGTSLAPKMLVISTLFETAARFTAINNSGTNSYSATGLILETSATGGRAAGVTMNIFSLAAGNVFAGSPVFATSFYQNTIGTTGSSYMGLGVVTKDGTGHTYTTDHCGFKVLAAAGVASLYATQGNGSTETASSALTTIATTDQVDVMLKINGSSSIDYYWRKNGGTWSSATNLATNLPDTASALAQFSTSNNSTAAQNNFEFIAASYSR